MRAVFLRDRVHDFIFTESKGEMSLKVPKSLLGASRIKEGYGDFWDDESGVYRLELIGLYRDESETVLGYMFPKAAGSKSNDYAYAEPNGEEWNGSQKKKLKKLVEEMWMMPGWWHGALEEDSMEEEELTPEETEFERKFDEPVPNRLSILSFCGLCDIAYKDGSITAALWKERERINGDTVLSMEGSRDDFETVCAIVTAISRGVPLSFEELKGAVSLGDRIGELEEICGWASRWEAIDIKPENEGWRYLLNGDGRKDE